jgi:hypothetical protein
MGCGGFRKEGDQDYIAKNSITENSIARTTEFGAEENISGLGKEMYFISKK